jgi:leucyl/phenylalanyl-tRNA--protein transferase
VHMVGQFARWKMPLIDCQMPTAHLASLGAREIPRAVFLDQVSQLVQGSAPPRPWRLDADLSEALGTMTV